MLIVIGALIGGLTNSLAIKMLFRPLHPIYLGKWRLPFTPGLIPRRRDDMAVQLGKVVVEHLLTPEGIIKKFSDGEFQNNVVRYAQKEFSSLLTVDESLVSISNRLGISDVDQKFELFMVTKIEESYWAFVSNLKGKTISEILPSQLQTYVEENIPNVSELICSRAVTYFESPEGKSKVGELINEFLADKGTLGNIINMFLGSGNVLNKVHPEIIHFLQQPSTKRLLEQLLMREWTNVIEKECSEFDTFINYEAVLTWIQNQLHEKINLQKRLNEPLHTFVSNWHETVTEIVVPTIVNGLSNYAIGKIDVLMAQLPLAEVVKEQVESFPVERIETIVLTISSREFKMITYLGALLGALIGFVQGILILFI